MRLAPLPVNMFFGLGLSFDPECLRTNPRKVQPIVTICRLLTLRTPSNDGYQRGFTKQKTRIRSDCKRGFG